MTKLEGIIFKTFDHYVTLRGFAPLKDLASISINPKSYQRSAISKHKKEIIEFLSKGEYKYYPEITLACRANRYTEFEANIGIDNAIDRDDSQFVPGLKVLAERLPYDSYRARHAKLTKSISDSKLIRVDGNHRLEPFDDPNDPAWEEAGVNKYEIENLIVPYTVIFSNEEIGDKFEAGIFHNINFRQEPLKQEASLKIIADLNAFDDKEKLGTAYPLALSLIDRIKNGLFNDIYWLMINEDADKTYFRTVCLKIAELLISRKEVISNLYDGSEGKLIINSNQINSMSNGIENINTGIIGLKKQRNEIEIENQNFKELSTYRKCVRDINKKEEELKVYEYKLYELEAQKKHLGYKQKMYENYLKYYNDPIKIIEAIHSLKGIYENFEPDRYGNIAMLATMVYYSLLDNAQLIAFTNWAKYNGVNNIIEPDDISKDAAENLINMFEQIFQSKKNEIFISMQFGDSQSELIYEKIVRAIEKFNAKHRTIHLNARPIRIDRAIESSAVSISKAILEAIESCSLIIADLSSANINVYHEIGYAMGIAHSNKLEPNMILLYKENTDHNKNNSDIDKFIGFNLRNLSQLRFKDYQQLVDGLIERLEKHYDVN